MKTVDKETYLENQNRELRNFCIEILNHIFFDDLFYENFSLTVLDYQEMLLRRLNELGFVIKNPIDNTFKIPEEYSFFNYTKEEWIEKYGKEWVEKYPSVLSKYDKKLLKQYEIIRFQREDEN